MKNDPRPRLSLPPTEYLHECFLYDPETGIVTWKERPRSHFKRDLEWKRDNRQRAGKPAGTIARRPDGTIAYLVVSFRIGPKKFRYYLHHIIFALMGVEIPEGFQVDHRNGQRLDNRWGNLRLATSSQNAANKPAIKTKQMSLPKGVYKVNAGKFSAVVDQGGKRYYLGRFTTPEAAHAAYCEKAKQLHGQFSFNSMAGAISQTPAY